MLLRNCRTKKCLVQNAILDHVQKYVDPRAHLHQDELRYSMKVGRKWKRMPVLRNTDMKRIFGELYEGTD